MAESLKSDQFEVTIHGSHGVFIPDKHALPFADAGHKRVRMESNYQGKTISFYGALQNFQGRFVISFGKRYQKQLGVSPADFFELQLFEDKSEYGVEMPEEFQAVLESDLEAMKQFQKLTDGKKRSLIYHILKIKNSQTRIEKALVIANNLILGITDQRELTKDRR